REALERCWEKRTLRAHQDYVWVAAFSPDGRRLLTAGGDQTARVWEAESGKLLVTLAGHHLSIASASFSPDGTKVVLTYMGIRRLKYTSGKVRNYSDRVARLWDAATGRELVVLRGHQSRVVSAAFSPDGKQIVTASW